MARTWCCHTDDHSDVLDQRSSKFFLYFLKHGHLSLQELVEDLLCRPRGDVTHSHQTSVVGALFAPEQGNRPRHYNKYLNNSVNEPHLVDLDCPSGTLNSVAETTSVFCAVWMYTVRMERTWCCQTLSCRRFSRCTGPVGPPLFPVLPETKATDFASPQKRSQLAPQSAFVLVPVGPTSPLRTMSSAPSAEKCIFRHFLIELFRQEEDIVLKRHGTCLCCHTRVSSTLSMN